MAKETAAPARCEPLEDRALRTATPTDALTGGLPDGVTWMVTDNHVLILQGTAGDDRVDIRSTLEGVELRLDASGEITDELPPGTIKSVIFDGGSGHDSVTLDAYTHTDTATRRVERRNVVFSDGRVETDFATSPDPRDGASGGAAWLKRFAKQKKELADETGSTLFVGDSLMERFPSDGPEQWRKLKEEYDAIDAGMAGDTTASLLYRLNNGLLDGLWPRAIFVCIGTNNVALTDDTSSTVRGIDKVISKIRDLRPKAKIILSSILPRTEIGDGDNVPEVNATLAKLARYRDITFADATTNFDDYAKHDFSATSVHPTRFGYARWLPVITNSISSALRRK